MAKKISKYFLIDCKAFRLLKFEVPRQFASKSNPFQPLAVPSDMSVNQGLRLLKESPFKTLFVIDAKAGKVRFAITQNEEYVTYASKRRGGGGGGSKGPRLPDDITPEACCAYCLANGADGCMQFEDGRCMCLFEEGGGGPIGLPGTSSLGQLMP
ncbi:MAG: hypothetical protein Q8S27_00845 [Hoeflea sp.]|uniref:hypothetical protein n=1 Tax=Hoeflea sp. TaxID=1940281 RepID=UPI0027309258|nr:hypothetical protein [Hoeflea sp.]MDP2119489.1 hypothetical protein [Hoeflea sp.]MDP3523095.1 hypothetical protein [Hoeflea sp.]